MAPAGFKVRMIADAAKADTVLSEGPKLNKNKYDVVVPIFLPDEGGFTWLDQFLEKNPHFVELSDRKLVEWISKSGQLKAGGASARAWRNSNDKPDINSG